MMKSSDDWHSDGRQFQIEGKTEQATYAYRKALKLEGERLDSINNLAVLKRKEGLAGEADKLLLKGLQLASMKWMECNDSQTKERIAVNWSRLLNSSSVHELQKKQYKRCLALTHQQLLLEPEGCGYVNLGVVLECMGSHSKAARSHLLGLRRHNLEWRKPEELIGKSLLNPSESSQLHLELSNLATSRLHGEPLKLEHWKLLLSRLGVTQKIWAEKELPWQRLWSGEACKDLLVWDEQGYGDALQCLRWIDKCACRTQQLTLMLRPELIELIKNRLTLSNNCNIVHLPSSGPPLTKHAWHCPLMGLPVALASGQSQIPTPRAPKGKWLQSVYKPKRKKTIGIVWAAGRKDTEDAKRASERRSMTAETLLAHAVRWKLKWGTRLISLQLDAGNTMIAEMAAKNSIQQLKKGGDWESTAQVVEQLDLVVSVDTAMVHLAGNLGVPCLLLLNRVHDWRWGTEEAPQEWYPRQATLRCKKDNDWERVLEEAESWVKTLLNE